MMCRRVDKAAEEEKDKYGDLWERSLTAAARVEGEADPLERLVLLTLAKKDTNHSSNLITQLFNHECRQ